MDIDFQVECNPKLALALDIRPGYVLKNQTMKPIGMILGMVHPRVG